MPFTIAMVEQIISAILRNWRKYEGDSSENNNNVNQVMSLKNHYNKVMKDTLGAVMHK